MPLLAIFIDGIEIGGHTIVVALGLDATGRKHVLGLCEGSTENAEVCASLLGNLIGRGLVKDRALLFITDGGKGIAKAIADTYGALALHQRCRSHKRRDVMGHLPEGLRPLVGHELDAAWAKEDPEGAERALRSLASSLEESHPGAAACLREGLEETLTISRLSLSPVLVKTLTSTSPIASLNGGNRVGQKNVKRSRGGKMAERRAAAAVLLREKRFRRINGYRDLCHLERALDRHAKGGEVKEERGPTPQTARTAQRTAGASTTFGTSSGSSMRLSPAGMRKTVGGVALSFVLAIVLGISGVIAPGGAAALAASTTLTILGGEVQVSRNGGAFEPATDGAIIGPGDVIRTAADSRAVLTYFEGSTVSVEPSSELAIDEASTARDGSTIVVMTQNLGRTWHVVTKLIIGGSRYEVRTPAATASVRGTAFEVDVARDATGTSVTHLSTAEGAVAASAPATAADPQPAPVVVAAGFQAKANVGDRTLQAPTLAPEPERTVSVNVGSANSLVVDSLGRSNGFKDGKLVLQTPGAQVVRTAGSLLITLPNIPDGKLSTVVTRPSGSGSSNADVPVTTTVQERGKSPTLVQDSVKPTETVTGVEVKKSGSGPNATPEVRRVTDDEKKDLRTPKTVVEPPKVEPKKTPPGGGGDLSVVARNVQQSRPTPTESKSTERKSTQSSAGTPPGESGSATPRGHGFVQPLPFRGAPVGTEARLAETKREDDKDAVRAEAQRRAAEQLERAAEDAKRRAEAERDRAEDAKKRAEEDAKRAAERAKVAAEQAKLAEDAKARAEQARRKADEEAAKAKDESAKKALEDESKRRGEQAARAEADRKAADEARKSADEARRKAEREAARKGEDAKRNEDAAKASERLREHAEEARKKAQERADEVRRKIEGSLRRTTGNSEQARTVVAPKAPRGLPTPTPDPEDDD